MYSYLLIKYCLKFKIIDNYLTIFILRFIGNLIISYELYQNGKSSESDTKILEIGNWLEKLDKGIDEFYLSINAALKHIQMANFVHMLFAANGTGGFKLVIFCLCM